METDGKIRKGQNLIRNRTVLVSEETSDPSKTSRLDKNQGFRTSASFPVLLFLSSQTEDKKADYMIPPPLLSPQTYIQRKGEEIKNYPRFYC